MVHYERGGYAVINTESIKLCAYELGADLVGIARPEPLDREAGDLNEWLKSGYYGSMSWMNKNVDVRNDPTKLLLGCKSIIVIAVNYYTPQLHLNFPDFPKISRYAWGRDYHKVLRKILKDIAADIRGKMPDAGDDEVKFLPVVDTMPFRDKVWAQRAGIGWIGKNSVLTTREYGSWVFIGALLTTLDLGEFDSPHANLCGKCTRCIDACPTSALDTKGRIDSRACLSYLTIEHSGNLPNQYRDNTEGWIFGCDACQDVCPWNRFAKPTRNKQFYPRDELLVPDLKLMSQMSEDDYNHLTTGTCLRRAGRERLRRNALAVMGLL